MFDGFTSVVSCKGSEDHGGHFAFSVFNRSDTADRLRSATGGARAGPGGSVGAGGVGGASDGAPIDPEALETEVSVVCVTP